MSATQTQHEKSEYWTAYGVYVLIFVAFVTVCATAIIVTSSQEANKKGFQAITTKTPTSFIDNTYTKKNPPQE